MSQTFGEFFKEKRLQADETDLSIFCGKHGFFTNTVRMIEMGQLPPPDSVEKLEMYAEALDITGNDYRKFLKLAKTGQSDYVASLLGTPVGIALNDAAKDEECRLKVDHGGKTVLGSQKAGLRSSSSSSISPFGHSWTLHELIILCHKIAKEKGFWDEERNDGECIALMHSELSEALEAWRHCNPKGVAEELADLCIRVFDYCGAKKIDLGLAIEQKMAYNKTRPHKHGKAF